MGDAILLIDLSSIAVPIWKMSGSEPDPNHTCTQTVGRVRALASGVEHVAICCDSGRSFRHDLNPAYKAQRPQSDAAMHHQIRLACEQLTADGFPVWSVPGFEADDVIASATYRALEDAEAARTVVIASADKDLLQLVNRRVVAKSLRDGAIIDAAAVQARFGVTPEQMRDYLTLVGDASDNIRGAKGIGAKRAAELLTRFGTLIALYRDIDGARADVQTLRALGLTPAIAQSLLEFAPLVDETRALITLRTDVELPFTDVLRPRVVAEAHTFAASMDPDMPDTPEPAPAPAPAPVPTPTPAPQAPSAAGPVRTPTPPRPSPGHDIATSQATGHRATHGALVPAPAEWSKQLEPRSMSEAGQLAKWIYESRQFSAYGTPAAVLATILAGRELGLQAMAALRAIHIVEGKPTLSADLIRALVIRSGLARYFRCVERTPERATFETQRGDDPPLSLTFTLEEGRAMWAKSDDAWTKSGWGRNSADMCVARASAKLARLVYPETCFGLYTRDELEDGRVA